MFHHLYICLNEIGGFLEENPQFLQLMISDYYMKAHFVVQQQFRSVAFALL